MFRHPYIVFLIAHTFRKFFEALMYSGRGEGQRRVMQNGAKEKKRKKPPGPIKCLINSRRRIGRNNKHLSEPFIAWKTLLPAFSHLIFTTGLGGRCYHYLHLTGEESMAPAPPCWGWWCRDQLGSAPPGDCHNLSPDGYRHGPGPRLLVAFLCFVQSQGRRHQGHLLQGACPDLLAPKNLTLP